MLFPKMKCQRCENLKGQREKFLCQQLILFFPCQLSAAQKPTSIWDDIKLGRGKGQRKKAAIWHRERTAKESSNSNGWQLSWLVGWLLQKYKEETLHLKKGRFSRLIGGY